MSGYRLRNGIIAIIIGLFIISRFLHVPIPFISTLSFFHLFLLIAVTYFITGIFIGKTDTSKKPSESNVQSHKPREAEPVIEPSWTIQQHVETIKQQYDEHIQTFVPLMQSTIINEQLYECDKMKHANFFYSILKKYNKVEAMWTEKLDGTIVASVPSSDQLPVLPQEARQLVLQQLTYTTPLDALFGEANFIQTIVVPISSLDDKVVGYMVMQIKTV